SHAVADDAARGVTKHLPKDPGGFEVRLGGQVVRSGRPTLLIARLGEVHRFELTPDQAAAIALRDRASVFATLPRFDEPRPPPPPRCGRPPGGGPARRRAGPGGRGGGGVARRPPAGRQGALPLPPPAPPRRPPATDVRPAREELPGRAEPLPEVPARGARGTG